jgi:hypothetical protein
MNCSADDHDDDDDDDDSSFPYFIFFKTKLANLM